MFDQKRINAVVNKIATRPSDFSARMAAGKKAAAANRASSNAPPSPKRSTPEVRPSNLNSVKPKATKLPKPASSGSGPTQQTGPGKHITINIHNR